MINSILTILVAVSKVGSIYARSRRDKQVFQSAAIILIMIIILKNEDSKKKGYSNKYNNYYDKRSKDEF